MKRKIVGILVCMLLIVTNIAVLADWDPKDGHKMHFPQLPDPNGWDVWATEPFVCADDWRCSESGYVKDIHFWGSWKDDNEGTIVKFKIWIYSDIPADQNNPYSKPGELLKYLEIRDFTIRSPYQGDQGWYEPVQHYWISHDHQNYYQYNVFLDKEDWFEQERNTIYWLAISAVVIGDEQWGWKSSSNHWNDDACWAYSGEWDWIDLWEPPYDKVSDSYSAQFSYGNDLVQGGGTGFDGMWYYYWETNWWNMWFYNEPFDDEKMKRVDIGFTVESTEPGAYITFALNYATPEWPPGQQIPPLPELLEPGQEDQVIQRVILFEGEIPTLLEKEYTYYIKDYNPEWVSVDVMGQNFLLDGWLEHTCFQSLDLAFVINGEEGEPSIDIDKKVSKDDGITWSDEVDVELDDTVRFKITVENDGDVDLNYIKIIDTLPSCLEYADNADPVEPIISGGELTWIYTYLNVGQKKEIEFDAKAIEIGENINEVSVTTLEEVSDGSTATVNVGEIPVPKIGCEGELSWSGITPNSTVTGTIYAKNIGDPGSKLKWKVCGNPSWGTWNFNPPSGTDLKPSDGLKAIDVTVMVPNQQNQQFSGQITLCNEEDSTDTRTIQVSLATPKNKAINSPFIQFLEDILQNHLHLFPLLRQLLALEV